MPEHIGIAGTRAMAWVRRVMLPFRTQTRQREGMEKFTERVSRLSHRITHANQQAQSRRLPQHQVANQDSSPAPAALPRKYADAMMLLPAPAQNTQLTTHTQRREAQAHASEQVAVRGLAEKRYESAPRIDVGEVADRIYRLMQHDLTLERERATKLGG